MPAVSLPLHWTRDGLPVGVMLAARPAEEAAAARAGRPGRGGGAVGPPEAGVLVTDWSVEPVSWARTMRAVP